MRPWLGLAAAAAVYNRALFLARIIADLYSGDERTCKYSVHSLFVSASRSSDTNEQTATLVRKEKRRRPKGRYSSSWERHLRAIVGLRDVTCYGITHCYLPPDTSERAPPNPSHAVWYSTCTYPGGMEGWVDLVDLVALRPAVYTVSLIAVNGHLNLHTVHSNQMITSQARPWKHTGSLGSCHV